MTYRAGISQSSGGRIALALFAALAIFMVFAFSAARVANAHGNGSPPECDTAVTVTPAGGDDDDDDGGTAREVTISADEGEVITGICIKSGSNMFDGNKHSGLITEDGLYDDCYTVAGIGTADVTVTAGDEGPECQGISHVDVVSGPSTGDDDDTVGDDDDDTGGDDDDTVGDDDDDEAGGGGVLPGNPPTSGTAGGNPNTAMTVPGDPIIPSLISLFALAAFGGLSALRLARRR